jgi:predicted nucleic acid-binding protein
VQIVSDLAIWQVHQPDVSDVLEAIRIQSQFQLSFWDAMIVTIARHAGPSKPWLNLIDKSIKHGT